jgi:Ribonucleotide reductase, barrel domain
MNQPEYLKNLVNSVPQHLALTGRIVDWLNSPESRLPASCTTFSVEDSMEGRDGIEDSWIFTSHGLRNAAGVAIDLSKLRPKDTDNGRGLVSSGAVSFGKVYSQFNELLRRGGIFKNGSITLFLDHNHPDCEEYLNATYADFPWAKRAVYVDDTLKDNPLLPLIAEKVNQGVIWLAKKQWDSEGERLYSNVCQEIVLKSRGTCLIANVNLGSISNLADLIPAFEQAMLWLCQLHGVTGVGESLQYLDPKVDRQVGLGVLVWLICWRSMTAHTSSL